MTYVILTSVSLALLIGFYGLTVVETRRGQRLVLSDARRALDTQAHRVGFILAHIDFVSFAREESLRLMTRMVHASAHLSLRAVRAAERTLSRLVRRLRMHQALDTAPSAQVREFVQTLSEFKSRLKVPVHVKLHE